jgi:hypothetical protein
MARHDDSELMMHADGELDEATAREVEDEIVRDADARGKVTAVGQLGELVRGHLELSADAIPEAKLGAMWRAIEQRVERAPAADDGGRERERDRDAADKDTPSTWRRLSSFFDRYRGHIITGVVSAGAVAALALVFRPGSSRDAASTDRDREPIGARPAAFRPAQIESLDTPGGNATVFHPQDEDGAATVIMVTPADTVEGL